MKKALIASLMIGFLAVQAVVANTIVTTATGNNGGYNGGEFLSVLDGNPAISTFCLEDTEFFYPGRQYSYSLSDRAIGGGANHDGTQVGYDVMSQGTAWLYLQYRSGALPSVATAGGAFQMAIWMLEDEVAQANNAYLALAVAHFGGSFALAQADYSGNEIRVINVWDANNSDGLGGVYVPGYGYARQDVIGVVPDGGMTLALLGMGLTGLGFVSRRFRK